MTGARANPEADRTFDGSFSGPAQLLVSFGDIRVSEPVTPASTVEACVFVFGSTDTTSTTESGCAHPDSSDVDAVSGALTSAVIPTTVRTCADVCTTSTGTVTVTAAWTLDPTTMCSQPSSGNVANLAATIAGSIASSTLGTYDTPSWGCEGLSAYPL
jgi:hypothetical protein